MTKASATALAGQGLMGVARDDYPRDGETYSFVAFTEVEVDVETGQVQVTDFLAVADVGTVINPRSLGGQVLGVDARDQPCDRAEDRVRPALRCAAGDALLPESAADDSRRSAEEALGGAEHPRSGNAGRCARHRRAAGRRRLRAMLNALSDALGDNVFRRAPVMLDTILTSLEAGHPVTEPLTAHI